MAYTIDQLNALPDQQNWQSAFAMPTNRTQSSQDKKKKKNFWIDQISTAGGIVGGIGGGLLGSLAGGVGAVPGAAIGSGLGSALGEGAENLITGNNLTDNVLKEGTIGTVLGVGPLRALKGVGGIAKSGVSAVAGRSGGQAAKQTIEGALKDSVTQQPLKTSLRGKASALSDKLLTSQYGTISKPIARQNRPEETFGTLANLGLTRPQEVETVAHGITGANGILNRAVVKSTGQSARVDVSDLRQVLNDAMELNGVVERDAKELTTMFDAQMKRALGGPKGSLNPTAHPNDVLDIMKSLEARIAQKTGRGGNARLANDQTTNQANALQLVRDELQDRLESGADVSKVLTPELRKGLLELAPNNAAWKNYVDNTVMKSRDISSLRGAQSPFVRAKNIIDEADVNSMTFGGRGGNAANGIKEALQTAFGSAIKNPVTRAASRGLRTLSDETAPIAKSVQSTAQKFNPARLAATVGVGGILGGAYNQLTNAPIPQNGMPETEQEQQAALQDGGMSQSQPVNQSKYPLENAMADIQRDPANADYYMELYKFANQDISGGNLSSSTATQLTSSANAVNTLDQLEGLFGNAGGGSGRISGSIQNALANAGFNGSAQTYNDLSASSVSQLARALNGGGQVSDADAAVVIRALPRITDSPDVAARKFAALRARLQQAQQNTLMYGAGINNSGDLESSLAG